jgi:peroxiredoxin/outer membrane lipoprotein-sorting protein
MRAFHCSDCRRCGARGLIALVSGLYWLAAAASAEEANTAATTFQDEPAAHAMYDQMIDAMRKADSLSFVSHHKFEVGDKVVADCRYYVLLKKPNFFRVEVESNPGTTTGVLVGDGENLWIHWPQGRPNYSYDEFAGTEADPKARLTCYMTKPTPLARHSIGHETMLLGVDFIPIIDASTFHGYTDSLQEYIDGVRSLGTETVGADECDGIEVSIMNGQRSWYLWLSRQDHLPRKLKQIVRVSNEVEMHEDWSSVTVNGDISDDLSKWTPPEGWTEWVRPDLDDLLLKPGAKAPDFELAAADGKQIKLSDYQGQVVWLCVWRVGCPPCREEAPVLQDLHLRYRDEGLVILGFNSADEKDIALDFIRETGTTFPMVLDSSEAAQKVSWKDYHCSGVPVNYIIDRDGKVVDAWYGYGDGDDRAMKALKATGGELAEAVAADEEPSQPPEHADPAAAHGE